MAEVHPFRGVRYNQQLVKDISIVISPPYDIITPQMAPELYRRSEYNFVRIEANRELPQDTAKDNKYTRSTAILEQWLEQAIFQVDEVPTIYLHDHYFVHLGREYKRRGITLCIRLEEWDKMVVRPHEGTLAEPKNDRLNLLWALQLNTSPILALYEDKKGMVSSVLAEQERNKPIIASGSVGGERHNVWAITEGEAIDQIRQSLAHQPVYIADGHHRYESALAYRREMCTCTDPVSGDEPFNFVMMTLVTFDDPGLIILPPHRMIRGISRATLDVAMARMKMFFDIDELLLAMPDIWRQVDNLLAGEANTVKLVLFGLAPERLFVLKLRDLNAASRMMPYFHSELYKRLDVSIVDHIILEKVLELSSEREKAVLGYSHSREDAISRVSDQEYQLAFLLSPVTAETVKAVADAGDRMPRKSTYFYPKAPSGLVFYRLV
jgi:uncharacterized protein (DUF1015 family)